LAIAPLTIWMRGFAIDDAFISVRYARHLAAGLGYRFNAGGPSTDGVTPLPWPFMLAPLARGSALDVLQRAKWAGVCAWAVTVAVWGFAVGRAEARTEARITAIMLLAMCVRTAAHAGTGMETSFATLLATVASILPSPWTACVVAGLTASLRPEMVVWAVAFALLAGPPSRAAARVVLAAVPFVACACVRLAAFGRAGPLALLAKPSDLSHGLIYAMGVAPLLLAPIAALAPIALLRARGRATALAGAGCGHFAAMVVAGGDWMAYGRLAAPIVPSLLYAFVLASPHMSRICAALRIAPVVAFGAFVVHRAAEGRHVQANYASLIERARPILEGASRVAALDVGWPTAATEATMIDLAGLTDPEIAVLPGGHTSKHVDAPFLIERDPDVILLYALKVDGGERDIEYPRVVEARLAASELLTRKYETRAFLPYGEDGAGYVVLWKRPND
jgi:hypothetical protein